jgi:hypothetical protein
VAALLSLLFGFGLLEASLRWVVPIYAYAADSVHARDDLRIWRRVPRAERRGPHPDTGRSHRIIYDNLGLRQHRDLGERELDGATNIGFFGDSYTENLRMAVQYSFTDVLDYLLDQSGRRSGRRYNVLNFGVDGYGTDQEYVYYRTWPLASQLRYVFYVLSMNDLRNIYENDLFGLDQGGELVRRPAPELPWYLAIASRLHTTYLLIDLRNRLRGDSRQRELAAFLSHHERKLRKQYRERRHSERADAIDETLTPDPESEDAQRSLAVFRALLAQWSREVEAHGGRFLIAAIPEEEEGTAGRSLARDYAVVNLWDLFRRDWPELDPATLVFRNDGHWNERGNMYAAIQLLRAIERADGLEPLPEPELERALARYYAAFGDDEQLAPMQPRAGAAPEPRAELEAIRRKYLALELAESAGQPPESR